jgi:glutathione S-transferase
MSARPKLWHIPISHYSEKARWALDYKGVEHERRTPVAGLHPPQVLWLTRGRSYTLPVLELDGRRYGDSTAIIAALEERFPDPPLYPDDPMELRRALDIEDFFDEEVAPYVRRAAFHEARKDERWPDLVFQFAPPHPLMRSKRFAALYGRAFTAVRYGAGREDRAAAAKQRVVRGFDRLERELGGRDHLVGDRFTVADLSAAAILNPVVLPPEGPFTLDPVPEGWQRLRETVADRPGFKWVEETFARHRFPANSRTASAPTTA